MPSIGATIAHDSVAIRASRSGFFSGPRVSPPDCNTEVEVELQGGGLTRETRGKKRKRSEQVQEAVEECLGEVEARGALQFSSRHQPPRRGRAGPEGGEVKFFCHFGGIFEFPVSF